MGLTRPRAYQIFDLDYKQSVRVITTTDVTITGGAPSSVDGVSLSAGDRILVAGQSTGSQNGLYQVSVLGTGSNGTWIRSVDGNETGEIDAGMIVMVTEGEVYKDTQWKLTTNDPIVIGTTALVFEQNSAFAFGNIYANGTAVLADIVGDTVTFTPANNLIITGNATSDTITFEVSQSPSFTGTLDVTGNITGGNVSTAGTITGTGNITGGNIDTAGQANVGTLTVNGGSTFTGNLLPSANVTYNLGSPTQRWNEIFLAANTIDIGGATISADLVTGSLILTGPDGAEFILSGSDADNALGAFGFVSAGNTEPATSTTTGAITSAGGLGVAGNIYAGGLLEVTGNITGGNLITTGTITGNLAGTANVANYVYVTESPDDNVTYNIPYLSPSGTANAPRSVYSDATGITFNPSTNTLTVSIGAITTISASTITVGTLNATVAIDLADDDILRFGTSDDWEMYHTAGGDNRMDLNTGNLVIRDDGTVGDPTRFTFVRTTGAFTATGNVTGGNLTTAGRVDATGNVTGGNLTTAGQVTATGNITGGNVIATTAVDLADSVDLRFGSSDDVEFYFSGLFNFFVTQLANTVKSWDIYGNNGSNLIASFSQSGNLQATGNITGGNLLTAGAVESSTLTTSGNAIIGGDLTVNGNTVYVNITDLNVQDPIIGLGRGENNAPLTSDDGKDRGEQLWYYTDAEKSAFIGYDNSADKLIAALDVTLSNEIVTVNSYGNFVVGGLEAATGSFTGNVDTGNISGTTGTFTNVAGTLTTAAQPNITSVGTLSSLTVTANVTGGNLDTAGQIVATGNVSGSTLIASGNIVVQSRQQVKFYDTDNSNFISLRAPNALTGDYVLTLPTGYGNADQVLSTNGAGTLTWVDQSGGGGGSSATSYPNSTVSPVPGSTGNFDLSYNFVQTSQEVPFETSATDAFGVNLGEVYSMMDPGGEVLEPVDLGVLT
jgi:hypothetical protein